MQQPDKHTLALPFEVINWFHHPFGRAIKYIFTGFLLACGILATTLPLQAGTITWVGGTDNNWATGANWDSTYAPGPLADVVIAVDGATVTLPNGVAFTVKSLTLGNGNGGTVTTLVSASGSGTVGFRLTVLDTVYIASDGHLNMQGSPEGINKFGDSLKVASTVTNGGTITLKHNSHISTTALTNNGTLDCSYAYYSYGLNKVVGNVTNSTTGTIKIEGNQLSRQGYLEVQGNLTNSGLVYLYTTASTFGDIFATLDVSGTFTNALTGTFVDSATTWDSIRSLTVGSFDNQGTFISRSDPNTYLFAITADGVAGSFVNGGHMDIKQSMQIYDVGTFVNSGTINIDTTEILYLYGFNNAGVYTGSGEQFHGNGTLSLTDVALNVSAFPVLDSLNLTMAGTSSMTLADSLIVRRTISGGTITANGTRNQGTFSPNELNSNLINNSDMTLTTGTITGDVTNNKLFTLSGGTINGSFTNNDTLSTTTTASTITGTLTNMDGAGLRIGNLTVGGDITNHGYTALTSAVPGGAGGILSAPQFINSITGTIEGETGYNANLSASHTFGADLVNAGTFISNFRINFSGGSHSNSGTIQLNQPAVGSYQVSNGQFNFQSGASFTNNNTVFIDTIASLYMSGSTYYGDTGTLDGTGTLTISGSSHAYLGQKFVVKDYGVKLSLNRSTIHVDSLINQATWVAYGDTVYADSVIINQGKLTLQPYYSSGYYYNAWYGSFINQDTLIVESYSSYSANEFLGGPVVNEAGALISVRSSASRTATLTVDSSFTNGGTLDLLNQDAGAPYAKLTVNKGWLTNTGTLNALVYSILDADLDNQGAMTMNITSPTVTLTMGKTAQQLTNSGTLRVAGGELKVMNLADFTNTATGTVRIDSGTTLQLVGPTSTRDGIFDNTVGTLSVAGTLSLSYLIADLAPKVVVSDSMTLSLYRAVVNTDSLINQGYLSVGGDTINGHVVNQDTASIGYWSMVNGSFENQAGAVLQLIGDLNNSSSTLTVDSALTNAGVMKLSTTFYNSRGFVLTISNGAFTNTPTGVINAAVGTSTSTSLQHKLYANLDNHGTFTLSAPTLLSKVDASHTNSGTVQVDTTLTIAGSGTFTNLAGGLVSGNAIIDVTDVAFTNAGTVNPGGSPGILTFEGDFAQDATGVINIEIEGDNPGTGYDQLNITGNAALAGSLNVHLPQGYSVDGKIYQVLT